MIKEALRYLGIQGEANEETLRLVLECMETIEKVATPKFVSRAFSLEEFSPYMQGEDIKKHVAGADEILLLVGTLGIGVDIEIKKAQAVDMARAAVLDACAAAFIEQYMDKMMPEGLPSNMRYSPGYGDYPLSVQPQLLKAAKAFKIGISVLDSYMLVPSKSVTAIVGIGTKNNALNDICVKCDKTDCAFRKEG